MRKREDAGRPSLLIWKVLFWLYLAVLFVFVVVKFNGNLQDLLDRIQSYQHIRDLEPDYNLNLTPFASIAVQVNQWPSSWAVENLVGNVAAFVPLGWLLPKAHRHFRHFLTVMLMCLVLICGIEVFQYITVLGACDVDDVILNMVGCLLGYLMYIPFWFGDRK